MSGCMSTPRLGDKGFLCMNSSPPDGTDSKEEAPPQINVGPDFQASIDSFKPRIHEAISNGNDLIFDCKEVDGSDYLTMAADTLMREVEVGDILVWKRSQNFHTVCVSKIYPKTPDVLQVYDGKVANIFIFLLCFLANS